VRLDHLLLGILSHQLYDANYQFAYTTFKSFNIYS